MLASVSASKRERRQARVSPAKPLLPLAGLYQADGGLALNPQHALTGAWGAAKLEAGVARTSIACSKRANSRVNFGADLNSFKIDFAPSTPLTRSRRSPTWVAKQYFG